MNAIELFYRREIFQARAIRSLTSSIAVVPIVYIAYHASATFHPFHPFVWLQDILDFVFSFAFLGYFLIYAVALFITSAQYAATYKAQPNGIKSVAHIVQVILLQPKILATILMFCTSSVLMANCMGSVVGGRYYSLTSLCLSDKAKVCVNDYKAFLMEFSAFSSFLFSVKLFLYNQNCLLFPVAEQPVYFRVKTLLCQLAQESLSEVWREIWCFYVYYCLVGSSLDRWIYVMFLLLDDDEYTGLRSWSSMLDVGLLYQAILCGVFIKLTWKLAMLIFNSYQTQTLTFSISNEMRNEELIPLQQALDSSKNGILQIMAYRDLAVLASEAVQYRRKIVFSLSQPGGHPKIWLSLSTTVLSSINELNARLAKFLEKSALTLKLPKLQSAADCSKRIETIASRTLSPKRDTTNLSKKWKPVTVLSKEFSDYVCAELFFDGQKHIWSVQGISGLVCSSYAEDKYGIAQQNLGDVLTTLITLESTVEKLFRNIPAITRRPSESSLNQQSHLLALGLRTALRSSLYKIAVTFGYHVSHISNLSTEHMKKLYSFTDFKE